jgi:hypothetical protein
MTVFHPGHEALHGFTVVVFLKDGAAAAGRYDHALGDEIEFLDACLSSPGQDAGTALLRRLKAEGPRPEKARLRLPRSLIARIEPFGDWLRAGAPGA